MFTTNRMPGRTAQLNDENWLYFSGTSYLGMAQNKDFQQILSESLGRYGTNFGGSRLSNLQVDVFAKAEQFLAEWAGAASALTVSSGTLAGQLVVRALEGKGKFYFAPGVHPALFGAGEYSDLSFIDWTSSILEKTQAGEPMVLFANAQDPLRAKKNNFEWLNDFPSQTPITLVLDDSHGIGVTGKEGAGIYSILQMPENVELIVIVSLGKALAIPGGMILAKRDFRQKIWRSPHFGGASPIIPAYLDAFLQAQDLYQQARQRLFGNVKQFSDAFSGSDLFQHFDSYPVFYTPNNRLAKWLQAHKVLISSFAYPTPRDKFITRIVISAAHDNDDIEFLIKLVTRFLNQQQI